MTGVAHLHHYDRGSLWAGRISLRIPLVLAAIAAVILLVGGFVLAAQFRAHTPPPQQVEQPMPTAPGTGP